MKTITTARGEASTATTSSSRGMVVFSLRSGPAAPARTSRRLTAPATDEPHDADVVADGVLGALALLVLAELGLLEERS